MRWVIDDDYHNNCPTDFLVHWPEGRDSTLCMKTFAGVNSSFLIELLRAFRGV